MTVLQAIVLGAIQGITEFLPISSSAHLVLVPHWLGWSFDSQIQFTVDILLHLGTLVAVIIYFRQDIKVIILAFLRGLWKRNPLENDNAKLGWLILLATIPAGLVGVTFKEFFLDMLDKPRGVSALLLVTALVIIAAELYSPKVRNRIRDIRWVDALIIGCFQALAILPGISRSGVTIVGGLLRKFTHESAARLSFLMAIPVMLGAGLVAGIELLTNHQLWQYWPAILAGFLTALLVGVVSIHWLLRYLQNHSLRPFAWYCVLVGLIGTLIGCSPAPAPAPIATKGPVYTLGVTSVTSDLVSNLLMKSPYSEEFQIQIYSSDRQLIKAVSSGGVESGVVLHFPDNLSLFSVPLALTKLHAIVQPDCDINELSIEDLKSVYTGTIVDWAEFGGASESIKLAVREEGDSARTIFESIVLANTSPSPVARVFAGDDLMIEYVRNTNGAIGYGWQSSVSSDVKSLKISESGLFSIPVYAISYKETSGVLRDWLAWVQQRTKTDLPEGFTPIP